MDISIIVKRNSRFNKSSFNNQLINECFDAFLAFNFRVRLPNSYRESSLRYYASANQARARGRYQRSGTPGTRLPIEFYR